MRGEDVLARLCQRYRAVSTAAIADVLDRRGLRRQVVDGAIRGLTLELRLAGPAFTCKGAPATELEPDDWPMRKAFLDALSPLSVVAVDAGGDGTCAHWGELMSTAARGRGCTGVVIDGGVRDVHALLEMEFPTFARYRSPASSILRWRMSGYGHPISLGGVLVRQRDFVVGDADGVVVVPAEIALEVLGDVERLTETEADMRAALLAGAKFSEAYDRYRVG